MIEQFSACVLLAQFGEPSTIPIILRSMYEALVDLDNLVHDASYHCRIEHANIKQTLSIMKSGPLREATSALAERHLSESKDGSPLISLFGKYDPKVVASRLDIALDFLFQGARMVHGAFQVPATACR
jgi:hypothetical protein